MLLCSLSVFRTSKIFDSLFNDILYSLIISWHIEKSTLYLFETSIIFSSFLLSSISDSSSDEEIANALCFSAELRDYIADKVEEANEMLTGKKNTGEMSDYERIQLLKSIKKELKSLRSILSDVQKRFKNKNSYALFEDYTRSLTCEMIFFGFDKKYGLQTSQVESVVKDVQKANKEKAKKKK